MTFIDQASLLVSPCLWPLQPPQISPRGSRNSLGDGIGEMAQQLRAVVALSEDLALITSSHMAAHGPL